MDIDDPLPIEASVTEQKLLELLKRKETSKLDFKASYDISSTRDKVELTKDVVAMANTWGGYILLGVSDDGDPVGLPDVQAGQIDGSKLRAQVESYLDQSMPLLYGSFKHNGHSIGLLFIPEGSLSPIVFAEVGSYPDSGNTRQIFRFRQGDVFVRHGSASERWNQEDVRWFITKIIAREKDKWMSEFGADLGKYVQSQEASKLAGGDLGSALLYVSDDEFEAFVVKLMRQNDSVGIFQLGHIAENAAIDKWQAATKQPTPELIQTRDEQIRTILDKLTLLGVLLIQYKKLEWLPEAIACFRKIYAAAPEGDLVIRGRREYHLSTTPLWKEIIARIYALGSVVLHQKCYLYIPELVRQKIDERYRRFWARHAQTMLAREHRLLPPSLCSLALAYLKDRAILTKRFHQDEEALRSFLCQFDFLQCIHEALQDGRNVTAGYPSFGIFEKWYTEPVVKDLVTDGPSRKAIPQIPNSDLASIIQGLDQYAAKEFFDYANWRSSSWQSQEIRNFLQRGAS